VLVEQDGTVSTEGFQAIGVLAQSIAGGGGQGGAATATANPGLFDGYNGTLQFGAVVAVGGQGGDGHNGGAVTVANTGTTQTAGYGAHGVMAQSIAGGGGHGADGTADVTSTIGLGASVGNHSGTAGDGGSVTVNHLGTLATTGGAASALVAQSISGGGGYGSTGHDRKLLTGTPGVGVLPLHLDFTLGVNLNIDDSSNGGAVTINSGTAVPNAPTPTVSTQGDFGYGLAAQSIGAGGGTAVSTFGTDTGAWADFSSSVPILKSGTSVQSAQGITLGALTGRGEGGVVNLFVYDTQITTGVSGTAGTGFAAYGVLAQSIGGGGGVANVDTAAAKGTIALGNTSASSSSGGHGQTVTLQSGGGFVTTVGEAAHGVVLQSIGGGGGVAAVGSSRAFNGTEPTGQEVNMTLGSRDSWGAGQTVTYNGDANVTTSGDQAFGVVAQSIGGGGGIAVSQQSGTVALGMLQASGTISSFNGGIVSMYIGSDATVATSGRGSHGVVAQSIGGGGGIANPGAGGVLTTTPGLVNSGTALGYGRAVGVSVEGAIRTTGAGANGVVAQVISGGGGLTGSFAGSTGGVHSSGATSVSGTQAGDLTITQYVGSTISVTGSGATAIFAQNATAGDNGHGAVTLSLSGAVSGGSGTNSSGIWVDGGNSANLITVNSGGVVSALSKQAITYSGARNVAVTNDGVVYGAVSLSGTAGPRGTFTNTVDASFYAEGTINAIVNDSGSLGIGTDDTVAGTATFLDVYTQFETGTVVMDIFSLEEYDQMLFDEQGYGVFGDEIAIRFGDLYAAEIGDTFSLIGVAATGTNTIYGSWFTVINNGYVSVSGLATGVEWETSLIGGAYSLVITAVPEPGSAVLVLAAVGLGMLRRRRG
jgi:hypothetical protein